MAQYGTVSQFPWLVNHEPPSVSLARGVQAGAQIANTMIAAKRMQLANSEHILATTRDLADQENLNLVNQGFAALSATMADIASTGKFDQSAKQKFFQIVQRYPHVVKAPGFNGFVEAFKTAETTAGRAELSSVMSTITDYTDPAEQSRFWAVAKTHPALLPEMEALYDKTFSRSETARWRSELVQDQADRREGLERTKSAGRFGLQKFLESGKMDRLMTRFDRMGAMQTDRQEFTTNRDATLAEFDLALEDLRQIGRFDLDTQRHAHDLEEIKARFANLQTLQDDRQAYGTEFANIKNALDMKRDALKPAGGGESARQDLAKSDEIGYRNELSILKSAVDIGMIKTMAEYEAKRTAIEHKYKARSRTFGQQGTTTNAPTAAPGTTIRKFNPATGKIE